MDKGELQASICTHIFFLEGHRGFEDMSIKIIDKTGIRDSTRREALWVYKLNTFVPSNLNIRDFN